MNFPLFATVVLDKAIDKPLDYGVKEELVAQIRPGIRVNVLVRGKLKKATVLATHKETKIANVLPLESIISTKTVLSKELLTLADWISRYYAASIDKTLSTMLPASVKKDVKEKSQSMIYPLFSLPKIRELLHTNRSKLKKQGEVLDVILQHPKGIFLTELLEKAKASQSSIDALIKKGIVLKETLTIDRSILEEEEFFPVAPKLLNLEQQKAYDAIASSIEKRAFMTHLLLGITGSGKTEVYLYAIEKALSMGLSVILLVPEIALTSQTIERLKSRIKERIAILHHRLSDGERIDAWDAMQQGKVKVVVGARSAIFSPLPSLGLIIVDEEQEGSYKQVEDTPCYHARDIAVMRGKIEGATVILGSATPSLESYHNAKLGKYLLHPLTQRAGNSQKPKVHIVDMGLEFEKNKGFTLFSDLLLKKMKEKIEQGEQVILFLNRRGYYTSQICTSCKKAIQCQHCDVSLTYHKSENILSCHLCGYTISSNIIKCPSCKKEETLKYRGPGTEQVERALHALFPDIKTLRMDGDTTRHKGSHDRLFKEFRSGKADVLIGTQMIAKGLHFPLVTLVGVINADSALNIPDFRANETVYQLITQVSGRSGRTSLPGEVVIQTMQVDHPIIKLAHEENFDAFYNLEIEERRLFKYPPFERLAKIIFSGKDPQKVFSFGQELRLQLVKKLDKHFTIEPIVPCGYAKIKDKHRYQCLIKGKNPLLLSHVLATLSIKKHGSIHVHIDIDPISTFS